MVNTINPAIKSALNLLLKTEKYWKLMNYEETADFDSIIASTLASAWKILTHLLKQKLALDKLLNLFLHLFQVLLQALSSQYTGL